MTVRAFFCSCHPLYRVPSYSINNLNVVMCCITAVARYAGNLPRSRYYLPTSQSERGFPVCANHFFKRVSFVLLRADGRQDDAAIPWRRGFCLDHLPSVLPTDAAGRIRIRARAGAVRGYSRTNRDPHQPDADHYSFSPDPLRRETGTDGK